MHPLMNLVATRAEGGWPDQLDVERFSRALADIAPSSRDVDDLSLARSLRDRLAMVLLDGSDAQAQALVNDMTLTHALRPHLDASGIRYRSDRTDALSSVWAEIAGILLPALASGVRSRIKRCRSTPCITAFVDSPGGTREYCCARCATRARVRRHRSAVTAS